MPCRFSFEPNEVDSVAVSPAKEPAALDAVLKDKAGEFFAWCVQGTIRYCREDVADEPPAVLEATASFFSREDLVTQFFGQAPVRYTGQPCDGVSLKDLARIWAEEGFGSVNARALGKMLRGRSDSCRCLGDFVAEVSASGGIKTKGRRARRWKLA